MCVAARELFWLVLNETLIAFLPAYHVAMLGIEVEARALSVRRARCCADI